MTHPDILYAETHGHGPWQEEAALACDRCGAGMDEYEAHRDIYGFDVLCGECKDLHVALDCELCGAEIFKGDEYSGIVPMCWECERLHTWTCTDHESECAECADPILYGHTCLSLPDSDERFCHVCARNARRTA